MPVNMIFKRVALWLLALAAIVLLWLLVAERADGWTSEAIVQVLAGLGGLGYWAYRSSSRVTARLSITSWASASLYIENIGNRVAKQVRVECNPPIPTVEKEGEVRLFGPVEDFGDMDRGQCYRVPVVTHSMQLASVLEGSTFRVSHESTWGFRRRTSTIRFGGGSAERYTQEDPATSLDAIAAGVRNINGKMRS